ncbi:MAG: ATP-binding protein [bacterium]|nr:ATP-binding protein [bacterium]
MPPHLAGRETNMADFIKLLSQQPVMQNLVLTGLRGVGKTVLMETAKPRALSAGWIWVGTDLSETSSISETNLATRILTDLSVATSLWEYRRVSNTKPIGFETEPTQQAIMLNFDTLGRIYDHTPGLPSDKLKKVLLVVAENLPEKNQGILFAYDEAQNLSDHKETAQYPLSLLLDVFQSIQRMNVPFLLVLAGLPTLFPKLVESRTYAERMFRVMFLDSLDHAASREAIMVPISRQDCPVKLGDDALDLIIRNSGGYPYFIQFICKEVYDAFIQQYGPGAAPTVPLVEIMRKLDTDFFAGRWARATDRQRELLSVIAGLDHCDSEFTVQQIVDASRALGGKPFSNSHVSQMLATLGANGLVYKNRYGKYSFAVPLLGGFIRRQLADA